MRDSTHGAVSNNLESGARLAVIGIVVNAVLALIKVSAGLVGNSYALVVSLIVLGAAAALAIQSVREGHAIAHKVKDAIRAANPSVADVLVHIEPAD